MISFSLQLHEVAFARRDVGSWWWLLWTQVITQDRFRWKSTNLYISIRCTPDHPCTHGEGHCKSDSDCERSGYHICGAACIGLLSNNIWSYILQCCILPLTMSYLTSFDQDQPSTQSTSQTTLTLSTLRQICVVFAGESAFTFLLVSCKRPS